MWQNLTVRVFCVMIKVWSEVSTLGKVSKGKCHWKKPDGSREADSEKGMMSRLKAWIQWTEYSSVTRAQGMCLRPCPKKKKKITVWWGRNVNKRMNASTFCTLSYAQRPLEHRRRNPNCDGDWGSVGKLHWDLKLEGVVLCPQKY